VVCGCTHSDRELVMSNENYFWLVDKKEGLRAHPSEAVALKHLNIAYFTNEILPTLRKLEGNVLEIAAGSCWLSCILKNRFPSAQFLTSDIAPNSMRKGIQVSRLFNCRLDMYVGCMTEKLPFKDNKFDYCIGYAALHHTLGADAIREINRILRPGGFYLGWGELSAPFPLKHILRWEHFGKVKVRVHNQSWYDWKKLFREAGFSTVNLSLNPNPKYARQRMRLYYQLVSKLPGFLIKPFLPCSINVIAKK
jgi:ubiquinone/menaquinone biosynthesis C-methylase UbiE